MFTGKRGKKSVKGEDIMETPTTKELSINEPLGRKYRMVLELHSCVLANDRKHRSMRNSRCLILF